MRITSVTLSVYHDGQFFSAVFETCDETGCRAARRVFATPPSEPEILALVINSYAALDFSDSLPDAQFLSPAAKNPKRRQRQAARAQYQTAPSTRAQAALQAQREAQDIAAKHHRSNARRQREAERFALRTQKKKKKHKGH